VAEGFVRSFARDRERRKGLRHRLSERASPSPRKNNRKSIRHGRVEFGKVRCPQLPYGDHEFDLVTAVETHYYWPDFCRQTCAKSCGF
jgi:hypothetical protein